MKIRNEEEDEIEIEELKIDTTILPTEQKTTLFGKFRYVLSNITVEPIIIIYVTSSFISKMTVQNLNLEKVCRVTKKYGDEICDPLLTITSKNTTVYEIEIQKNIAEIEAWRNVISTVLPLVILIYMGAWSDRTGNRKLCILLPIVGEILVNMSNISSTFFFNAVSAELTMLLEALFPAITGSSWLMYLGGFSYVTDITDLENRTFRVGLTSISIVVGMPIGMGLSGILLNLTGYYGVFCLSILMNSAIFMYSLVALSNKTLETGRIKKCVTISDVIAMQKETALVVLKKRAKNNRSKVILILIAASVVFGQDSGEHVIFYLFFRYRLNWDIYKFCIYTTYSCIMNISGCLFTLVVFSKWLGWHDSSLGILSIISKAISSIFMIFANTDFLTYMFPIVGVVSASKYTVVRSLSTKLVSSQEAGKINSLVGLMETVGGLVFNSAYSLLYAATMEHFTAAVFVFTALTCIPLLGLLLWLFKENRRESKDKVQETLLN